MSDFVPVSFQPHETIDKAKLDQFSANQQYLFDYMPAMTYKNPNKRDNGLKIVAGVGYIGPGTGQSKSVNVSYAGEFATGCAPIITTGTIVTNSNEHESTVTIRGNGTTLPNENGFQARFEMRRLAKADQRVKGAVYVHYMAMGYFSDVTA